MSEKLQNKPCECVNWCSTNQRVRILTGHHENCKHSKNALEMAFGLIKELREGIEFWASDEDGVHEKVWEAYKKASALELKFLKGEDNEQ